MRLGEIVEKYRTERKMSQRQFAEICDLSNGYISMLEKNINPKTGQPVVPTVPSIKKIADAMHMSMHDLFTMADDIPVGLYDDMEENKTPTTKKSSGRTQEFVELFGHLTAEQQALVIRQIKGILSDQ